MFLSYDGIVFDMLFLDGWQIEADMSSDGVDFLRWHHIIDVTCILNPAVTAANRFPLQSRFKTQINRANSGDADARLKTKTAKTSNKNKTGQVSGEDQTKKQLRTNATRGALSALGLLAGGVTVPLTTNQTKVLPSGEISVTPPLLSPQVLPLPINNQYDKWLRLLPSIPFVPPLSALIGPVFSNFADQTNGYVNNVSPAVFPANSQGTQNLNPKKGTSETVVTENSEFQKAWAAARLLGRAIRSTLGDVGGPIVGAGFLGAGLQAGKIVGSEVIKSDTVTSIVTGIASGLGSVQDEMKKQFGFFADALGITPEDIFGTGRQAPKVSFPTPPVKRRLNDNPPQAPGTNALGNTVPITFRELENRLANPRRELRIWLNTGTDGAPEYMVISPYPGMTVDAVSGPTCKMKHIPALHGNVTGILKLRFETWIAPPPELFTAKESVKGWTNSKLSGRRVTSTGDSKLSTTQAAQAKAPGSGIQGKLVNKLVEDGGGGGGGTQNILLGTPPIISNRWTMRQVPDPSTCLNTTVIDGVVHFRADVLQAVGLTADQLRMFFMHPIPFGYKRMPPEVVVNSDGTSVTYKIVDVQQMMNNPGGAHWGISNVDVKQHFGYNSPLDYARTPFSPFPALGTGAVVGGGNMFLPKMSGQK